MSAKLRALRCRQSAAASVGRAGRLATHTRGARVLLDLGHSFATACRAPASGTMKSQHVNADEDLRPAPFVAFRLPDPALPPWCIRIYSPFQKNVPFGDLP